MEEFPSPTEKDRYIDEDDLVSVKYNDTTHLFRTVSKFQKIDVYDSPFFGKILVIDDDLQLTEKDEKGYHEMLVHPALAYLPRARRVLIIGGGDGGTLREVAAHSNIQEISMIEIDEEVIKTCKTYFPSLTSAYSDPRLKLYVEDGAKWIEQKQESHKGYFDLVLIDSTDFNTAKTLFTNEFYAQSAQLVHPKGILVFNCTNPSWDEETLLDSYETQKKYFKHVSFCQIFQPTYAGGHYCFCFCSQTVDPLHIPIDWGLFASKNIPCEYYDREIHAASFILPRKFRKLLGQLKTKERVGFSYQLTAKGIPFHLLDREDLLQTVMQVITKIHKLTPLKIQSHKFEPQGVSINFLLSESYLSAHTWPERGIMTMDLFSCAEFVYEQKLEKGIVVNLKKIIEYAYRPEEVVLSHQIREI